MIAFIGTYLFAGLLMVASFMMLARQYWVFELFIHFTPQFAVLGLITVCLLAVKRKFLMSLILFLLVCYFSMPLLGLYYPPAATRALSKDKITVLSANVHKDNDQYEALLQHIKDRKPGIIALYEVDQFWIDVVKANLGSEYVSFIELPTDDHRGTAIFSTFTIASYDVVTPTEEGSPLVQVYFTDAPFALYAVHPLSPVSESWAAQRDAYIREIGRLASLEEGNLIIVGDMNSTPFSPLFRDMLKRGVLRLASDGFGLRTTWYRGTPLAIAIDHALYRGGLDVRNFEVLGDIGSDHRPILASFEFQE